MARRTKGMRRIRRLLRNMPDAARAEIVAILQDAATTLRDRARSRAPTRTAGLTGDITARVLARTLKARVGLLGKRVTSRRFYGHILNRGRKAQTVKAKRSRAGKLQSYQVRVRALAPLYFLPGNVEAAEVLQPSLQQAWSNILRRSAGGAGDD